MNILHRAGRGAANAPNLRSVLAPVLAALWLLACAPTLARGQDTTPPVMTVSVATTTTQAAPPAGVLPAQQAVPAPTPEKARPETREPDAPADGRASPHDSPARGAAAEKPEPTERGNVESLGMRYVNIPMVDKAYPRPEWVAGFMKTVDDPSTGKFYVHCAGGWHRTGAMGAVYRYEKYGWGYDQVYAEMKQFDFYTSWGHGDFKTFVEDYAQKMQARHTAPAAKAVAAHAGSSAESIFAGRH